jgi:GT2 family glycosyltransferase
MPATSVLTVIIVSYNTRQITLKCLRTLASVLNVPAQVIVVDNASTDGSAQAIAQEHPEVELIRNDRNVGFGAANNQAMRRARGAWFLLLNSDAYVAAGAIETLIAFLNRYPKAGAVGPQLLNSNGTLQRSCHRFPSPGRAWLENLWISALMPNHPIIGGYDRWDHDSERFVDFVSGACILLRRETYEHVGGFDESFFMYAEETDWLRRMHAKGWKIGFTPAAKVIHLGGASSSATSIPRHAFESLDRYECKHHGLTGLFSLRLAMVVGNAMRTGIWTLAVVAFPGWRKQALAKLRLSSWLLVRQATDWRVAFAR